MGEWQQAWTDEVGVRDAKRLFAEMYGADAQPDGVWASPGRVNLIGEHTDYNGGLCLPIALPHRTYVAARRRDDNRAHIATNMMIRGAITSSWSGQVEGIMPGVNIPGMDEWESYCGGPAWALREDGVDVPGFELAIASCVPLGAGLSSSAAVECAVGLALGDLAGTPFDTDDASRARLARLCMLAENEIAGAPTGGMDQAASLRSKAGHALLLDCLDGSIEHVPFDLDAVGLELLVIDTRASHSLADGQYGQRRASCEAAAATLGVATLREIADGEEPLDSVLGRLSDRYERRRVRHVVNEIRRVREFVAAASAGDWDEAGRLMNASHASLSCDYDVSCIELDTVVAAAQAAGALGARMTGGGFGGSAIALVRPEQREAVAEAVLRACADAGLATPVLHLATPSAPGERVA